MAKKKKRLKQTKVKAKKNGGLKKKKGVAKKPVSKAKSVKKKKRAAAPRARNNARSETPHLDTQERGQNTTDTDVEIAKGAGGETFETDSRPK